MDKECQIKDDEEILEEENNRFNFRRFKPEELEKKYSPFERTKKEFPFLFQKKREEQKENHKISLEEIITKVRDLSVNSPELKAIHENILVSNSPSRTPPYPPSPIPEYSLTEYSLGDSLMSNELKNKDSMNLDEQ